VLKVNSFRFITFIVILVVTIALLTRNTTPRDQAGMCKPIAFFPNPQNGYGAGDDQLAQPDDVEILSNGNIIITDVDNHRIQCFHRNGQLIKTIDAGTLGLADREITPTGLSVDGAGNLYITLEGAGKILRLTPDLEFDRYIGYPGSVPAEDYYLEENDGLLMNPQGLIVSKAGDVFVIDMAKDVFQDGDVRNFGFRKFKRIIGQHGEDYIYDKAFAESQEITAVMRKSEGMAISEDRRLLFIAEEKPRKDQFGNAKKYRYIAAFDLDTGVFVDRLIGVMLEHKTITNGYSEDSIEGLSIYGDWIFAVDEKAGRVDAYHIDTGERVAHVGVPAPFYCDDESDCFIEGVNYNEQAIMAGNVQVHLLNKWEKNELASPDGVCVKQLNDGSELMAVVDQWNSRILLYDLKDVIR